jgi:hypothetical protein
MELFLVYIWLKLSVLLWVLGITAVGGAVLWLLSKLNMSVASTYDLTYEQWIQTEDAKKLGANPTYRYTARDLYNNYCPQTTTKSSDIPLPKWFVWVPCTSLVLALLIPNQTDTAILVASSVAIDVAKSPEGTKIGQLLRGKANELLDAELKKLSPQPAK